MAPIQSCIQKRVSPKHFDLWSVFSLLKFANFLALGCMSLPFGLFGHFRFYP
jgi:hypothetical protein